MIKRINWNYLVIVICLNLVLSGCGGGGGSTTPIDNTKEAQLIDSAIQGVEYITNSGLTGTTTSTGIFKYNPTDTTIVFKVGGLTLADFNLSNLNSDNKLLPTDIFNVNRNDTTNANVNKFLRVVQSLDNDNNPSNGILIDDNTKNLLTTSINVSDTNISTLKTVVENTGKNFRLERESRNHFKTTLVSMGIETIQNPFVTVWETTASDRNITIPTNPDYASDYNYTVDWGDGSIENNITGDITHTYSIDGNHTVKISGNFPAIYFNDDDLIHNRTQQIQIINAWGDINWKSMKESFAGCLNIKFTSKDTPNLSNVTDMSNMFYFALNFNQDISSWDVSNVTNMRSLFHYSKFNQNINSWNVSNVTNMSRMFSQLGDFNQNLSDWNTSNVTTMSGMFSGSGNFNQDISSWDVSNVIDMYSMFQYNRNFNQDISSWDVSKVTAMARMFSGAETFNQDISDWNVSSVTSMSKMFDFAMNFNQDISLWDVSKVTNMYNMFFYSRKFNQNLSSWEVSNVIDMQGMFGQASSLTNQNLSGWNVNKVTNHEQFMLDAGTGNTEPSW